MPTIRNERFSAVVSPQGAELQSLKNRATGEEFIWQADPSVWPKSAPILFPVVGLLKNGRTTINGKAYAMPKHGFARERTFDVLEQGADRVLFGIASDAASRGMYPFDFTLAATFALNAEGLSVDYAVTNAGSAEMLFCIGSHPGFALDLSRAPLTDYFIEFSEPETLDLYGFVDGAYGLRQPGFMERETRIPLSAETFGCDALMFEDVRSRSIGIRRQHSGWKVEVDLRAAPHLGIWAKPGAPFVCIEPWFGHDDAAGFDGRFENKPGIVALAAGGVFETGYSVRIPA